MSDAPQEQVSRTTASCADASAVDVAETPDGVIVVRNGRFLDHGALSFTRREWEAFVRAVKDGEFDLPAPGLKIDDRAAGAAPVQQLPPVR